MDDIVWYSKKAKAAYELKPEDYNFRGPGCSPFSCADMIRVFHNSGQYVGYVVHITKEVTL